MHEFREQLRLCRLAAQGVAHELIHVVDRERTEHDLCDTRVGSPNGLQGRQKRMFGSHLVVAVGADEQETPRVTR